MSWFFSSSNKSNMDWINLDQMDQLNWILEESKEHPVLIFKHSTRCSISTMAKTRIESGWDLDNNEVVPVYLDLLRHRDISNKIESDFQVQHESPQILLIKNGVCTYTTSHGSIDVRSLKSEL